jgi:hypothetical protein
VACPARGDQVADVVDLVEDHLGRAAEMAARSARGSCAQNGWTWATSSTTPWTSSGRSVGTEPISSPVVGLNDSSVCWGTATAWAADYRVSSQVSDLSTFPGTKSGIEG